MTTWIALFSGINDGGNNVLPMRELRAHFEALGFDHVRSYVHGGNLMFDADVEHSESLRRKICERIRQHYAFEPDVLVLDEEKLYDAKRLNPFPRAASDPTSLYFFFLARVPENPDLRAIESARSSGENVKLIEQVLYVHTPEGIAGSKLDASVERHLGVSAIARDLRTVNKLLAMTAEPA